MAKLVTRESFTALVQRGDEVAMHAVGRAMVHLFNRQTEYEKNVNTTNVHNQRGFTPADAHTGCITAKYYIKHRMLQEWQVERWIKPNDKGVPRIAKYWAQMNEEANRKKEAAQ